MVASVGGCNADEVTTEEIRHISSMSMGSVWVQCPSAAIKRIIYAGKILVSWASVRVEAIATRSMLLPLHREGSCGAAMHLRGGSQRTLLCVRCPRAPREGLYRTSQVVGVSRPWQVCGSSGGEQILLPP